ncbi:nuclease-related domain-containing protein [Metabacillus sediminilitoris]|uniref:NERD domain-containing protein n=1 Tax=Metabacillus sediminilitoris TaxID=2567941 RepID=A0A4S4C032_9BACI|nr:nuclease-related domain-containing protein [Metabacillus sediminilitoris]QGQ47985.1 NERD domain-containing protein [Metabacillus sediminilitoris]THF80901.1 NERD domain-containing protein [Metabacillus sediminilitoris]
MPYKSRNESIELLILKTLNSRISLSDKDKQYYFNLKKGNEGEILFDTLTDKLQCECLILNDLLLKLNNTMFQIDALVILSDTIYLFEVKNYEGDYYYESDRLYKKPKSEITNPLNQLSRSESLLRQLLQNLGFNIPIHASVVFINPGFTLYQAPLNKPFIFPAQVNSYIKKLNMITRKLDKKHRLLADKLISLHIKDSPFKLLTAYDYDQLRKGITCIKCTSFSISVQGKKCVCEECGHEEEVTAAVMRNVTEFKLLFPDQRITTNVIHDWCKVVESKRRIRKILERNFKKVGVHQWTFYE